MSSSTSTLNNSSTMLQTTSSRASDRNVTDASVTGDQTRPRYQTNAKMNTLKGNSVKMNTLKGNSVMISSLVLFVLVQSALCFCSAPGLSHSPSIMFWQHIGQQCTKYLSEYIMQYQPKVKTIFLFSTSESEHQRQSTERPSDRSTARATATHKHI